MLCAELPHRISDCAETTKTGYRKSRIENMRDFNELPLVAGEEKLIYATDPAYAGGIAARRCACR